MSAQPLSYDFLPWARRGLARAHAATNPVGTPARPVVQVGLSLTADGATEAAPPVPLRMLGPGDVTGIDPRTIVRTEPRADARNVEPNYLAAVEFDPPDFPWLMTPARADANQRLAPWIVLAVFRRDELEGMPTLRPGHRVASVRLRADAPQAIPLPNLAESWMWAHAQLVGAPTTASIPDRLRGDPRGNVSRLVCGRRLDAQQDWVACVVPAFDAGIRTALGQPIAADATLQPAWTASDGRGLLLPVYHFWEFSTGPAGDFEALARRLRTADEYGDPTNDAYDPTVATKLQALGRVAVEVDADRLLQRGALTPQNVTANYVATYEGALVSTSPGPLPEPGRSDQIAGFLDTAITAGDRRALGNLAREADDDAEVPLVGPPAYGCWHARRFTLNPVGRNGRWLDGLNLSAPNRLAAGVGTRLVQAFQEEFMQAAWAQVGDVLAAERLLSRTRLAVGALEALRARIEFLPPPRRLQFLAPAAGRLKPGTGPDALTLWGRAEATSLPAGMLDGAMRRALSPARTAVKRAGNAEIGGQLVSAFATPERVTRMLATPRFRVDGIAGLAALDGMRLPTDPSATVRLPGFVGAVPVSAAQRLQTLQARLKPQLVPGAWRSPSVSRKLRDGVLLDGHWDRIGQFASELAVDQRALGPRASTGVVAAPRTTMGRFVARAGAARPEGVLLSAVRVQEGITLAAAQGLWVDARNGSLAVAKAPIARQSVAKLAGGGEVVARTAAGASATALADALPATLAARPLAAPLRPGQIGAVDIQAIRRLGNAALFTSLPVGAVQGPATERIPPTRIVADPLGRFRPAAPRADVPVTPPRVGDRKTVTLLPPERREPVLDRFRRAWHDRLVREAPAVPPRRVRIEAVPFDVRSTAAGVLGALDVRTLAERRVASLVSVGGGGRMDLTRVDGLASGAIRKQLSGWEQFVIAESYDRVMAYPKLDEPLFRRLAKIDRDAFMPGVGDIPQESILLCATNPRFVESFLVGANHEMNRELLWRGFPTDQRGTPFRRFWQYFDPSLVDIEPIHTWSRYDGIGSAGGAEGSIGRLALVVRGRLLQRYPNTNIYAVRKENGDTVPLFGGARETKGPIGGGVLPPDVIFFLFDIPAEQANQYWWVLEEPMTEPRFGFDDESQPREVPRARRRVVNASNPAQRLVRVDRATKFGGYAGLANTVGETWLDVDWAELSPSAPPGRYVTLAQLRSVRLDQSSLELGSTANAAHVARALLQRPFRGYFAGHRLVPG